MSTPTPNANPAPQQKFEFAAPGVVGLECRADQARITLATHDEPVVRVHFPDGGHDQFTVRMEGPMLTVSQRKPGLLARLVAKKAGAVEAPRVEITLPEKSRALVELGTGSVVTAATLDKLTVTIGRGKLAIHRSFGPLMATVDKGDAELGFIAAPMRFNLRSGKLTVDQLHAPAEVGFGSGSIVVRDMHASLDIAADAANITVEHAHDGIFALATGGSRAVVGVEPGSALVTEFTGLNPRIDITVPTREPIPGEPHVSVSARGVAPVIEVRDVAEVHGA